MKQKPPSEARSIGAFLSDPRFAARHLLSEAQHLAELQASLRSWASTHLGTSLHVAAERNGELVVHVDSAAALVEIRYRQAELLTYLQQRCNLSATRLVTKIVPTA